MPSTALVNEGRSRFAWVAQVPLAAGEHALLAAKVVALSPFAPPEDLFVGGYG